MNRHTATLSIALLSIATLLPGCIPNSITLNLDDRSGPVRETRVIKGKGGDKIALIDIQGVIGAPGVLGSSVSAEDLAAKLNRARRDDDVKAVILRINSPGGSVAASETLYHIIARFRAQSNKPVVVAMTEVAASGGYYIAMAADHIVAQPSTITGSVGVIIPAVNAAEGLSRIGIHSRAVTSGPNKDIANPIAPVNDEHEAILQAVVDDFYAQFRGLVLATRPDIADPDTTLDGRIFTGTQALEAGLVDQLGTVIDALTAARDAASAPRASLVIYHRSRTRPRTPYATAQTDSPRTAGTTRAPAPFAWPTIERPAGSGAYYLWLAPGVLSQR